MKKCQNHTTSALNGVPGRARTADVLLRRQTLYPTEVRRHIYFLNDYAENIQNLDSNGLTLRRRPLYTTELPEHFILYSIS